VIRLVHISDFHLEKDLLTTDNQVIEPLIKDISDYHSDIPITAIVCSGDLIDRGGWHYASPEKAFQAFAENVVDPLLGALQMRRDRFIIAPGNHDVVRDEDSPYIDAGLRDELKDRDSLNEFLEKGCPEGVQRMKAFESFRESFYDDCDQPIKEGSRFACFRFESDGTELGIVALDSAWRCYEDDEEHLLIGERSVVHGFEAVKDCDLKVAVHHHPLEQLAEFDRQIVKPRIERDFDMSLTGHVHSSDAVSSDRASTGLLFVSTAPGVLRENTRPTSRDYENGYRIIDIRDREITSHDRTYIPGKNKFGPSLLSKEAGGISTFRLPTDAQARRRKFERTLIEQIGTRVEDRLNEHLVTYGTDTCAPKTIRELFVAPELIYRDRKASETIDDLDEESVNETPLSLDDLLKSPDNFLLCGSKESGKTVLLDRLLTKIVDEASEYRLIPVHIKWPEIGNRRFESEVKSNTGVGSSDVESLCTNHNIVLLIDDMNFESRDRSILQRLRDFVAKYPRVRIIATHLQDNPGEIPVGLLHQNDTLNLIPLTIRSFGVQQIKALVINWFGGAKGYDMAKDIDRIVNLFQALSLPSNPLSISIFLWMIEKQEMYEPTNESTMMENFIERLFEKHSAREALSGRFDSHNKQRLLAGIAHFMYRQDNPDYSVSHPDLQVFIKDNLEAKKFDFNPLTILDQFVKMGIFSVTGSNVRFRFRCFFEYFLAKRIQYESDFENDVLENKLLAFFSEIKYLTGLQRDRTDILKHILDRMELEFHEARAQLSEVGRYDEVFEASGSFIGGVDAKLLLSSVEEARPTEEDIDADQNARLEMTTMKADSIDRKRTPEHMFERLSRLLGLAASVLKNTEETTEKDLKVDSYRRIVKCSLLYTVIYRLELFKFLSENEDNIPSVFESAIRWVADFTPIITQLQLHGELGTHKLNAVFRDEIKRTLSQDSVEELERFFAVFLYADSRGKNYIKHIKNFIKTIKHPYIENNSFLKIISYYYVRSRDEKTDDKLLNLMAELIVQSKGLPKSEKGRIIQHHKKAKLRITIRGDQNQTALAL
jgi:hypothetical protein